MKIINDGCTLVADDGYALKCKCHDILLGTEVHLNKIMVDGILVHDSIDNYTEVKVDGCLWMI